MRVPLLMGVPPRSSAAESGEEVESLGERALGVGRVGVPPVRRAWGSVPGGGPRTGCTWAFARWPSGGAPCSASLGERAGRRPADATSDTGRRPVPGRSRPGEWTTPPRVRVAQVQSRPTYRLAGGRHDGPLPRSRVSGAGARAQPGSRVARAHSGAQPRPGAARADTRPGTRPPGTDTRSAARARPRPADAHAGSGAQPGPPAGARAAPVTDPEAARPRTGTGPRARTAADVPSLAEHGGRPRRPSPAGENGGPSLAGARTPVPGGARGPIPGGSTDAHSRRSTDTRPRRRRQVLSGGVEHDESGRSRRASVTGRRTRPRGFAPGQAETSDRSPPHSVWNEPSRSVRR